MDSGLWHQMHFNGQPFTKNVVRIPGPSHIAMRFVSSISGVLTFLPEAANIGATEKAAVPPMKLLRVAFMVLKTNSQLHLPPKCTRTFDVAYYLFIGTGIFPLAGKSKDCIAATGDQCIPDCQCTHDTLSWQFQNKTMVMISNQNLVVNISHTYNFIFSYLHIS